MIKVFIGSHKKFERCEPVIEHSIRKNTNSEVGFVFLRPEYWGQKDSGCTGFSNMRWHVPRICGYKGHAIYLDVDMILTGDIAELWGYKHPTHSVCLHDGSTEVMVFNCATERLKMKWSIPKQWNIEDFSATQEDIKTAKLIHFTDLKNQPWFHQHPKPWLSKIWFDLEEEALSEKNKK